MATSADADPASAEDLGNQDLPSAEGDDSAWADRAFDLDRGGVRIR